MNLTIEQQLKELINETERVGAPAILTVLNQLLAAHQNGNHHNFARHCCNFLPQGMVQFSAQIGDKPLMQTMTELDEFDANSWGRNSSKCSH